MTKNMILSIDDAVVILSILHHKLIVALKEKDMHGLDIAIQGIRSISTYVAREYSQR